MYSAIYKNFHVVVMPRSIVDWRWEIGSVSHGYMSILLYIKFIICSGFPHIYASLEEGVGSVCHGYMCILLYMKLIWCHGFTRDLCLIGARGVAYIGLGISVFYYI